MALLDLQGMETPVSELATDSSHSNNSCGTGSDVSVTICEHSHLSVLICQH